MHAHGSRSDYGLRITDYAPSDYGLRITHYVWNNIAFAVLMALLGVALVAYGRAVRRWRARLRDVADERRQGLEEFATTDEYRRLRRAALLPILAATVIVALLYLLGGYR